MDTNSDGNRITSLLKMLKIQLKDKLYNSYKQKNVFAS
jgi:hypothetical protein